MRCHTRWGHDGEHVENRGTYWEPDENWLRNWTEHNGNTLGTKENEK